ncbi:sensor histidine kinase [Polaribacter sp.]|uniref:sensor histidine kinase n=1 Tax=Polaribacter sp. TaxID=1920175 RepID=UPI003F6AE2A0
MKLLLYFIICLISFNFYAQTNKNYQKTEEFILNSQKDSAVYYVNKLEDGDDKSLLKKIILEDNLSYSDYYEFLLNLSKRQNIDFVEVASFINKKIKEPQNYTTLNKDFFNIKWTLITQLRDKALLDLALLEQGKLESYVANFTKKNNNFLWANTKLQTHPIVMYFIENEIEEGKALAQKCIDIAREQKDVELEIIFLNYYLPFYVKEQKLNEYIKTCEDILELEKKLPEKSQFYYSTITDLINAYIFKGGYDEKVLLLMEELYNSHSRIYSYSLYAQLISTVSPDAELKQKILSKFKVNNVLELVQKFEELGKGLNLNDYFGLINSCALALASHNYYKEALDYKHSAIEITRKIYSQELSESLATFKTEQAVKIKEQEIILEKEKTNLYLIIASLCFALFLIAFFVVRKLKKQSAELSKTNKLVKKSLEEKELLIKEMHHRVKNNFQLITSLLELQTEEIQDEKVIELLEKGKSRIKSMSLIHQKLYASQSDLIKFDEFIHLLVQELTFLYKYEDNLSLEINVNEIYFDVDTAIPLALILNELVINSFKHAFKKQQNNTLYISLLKKSTNNYELIFKDNGPGFMNNFRIQDTKSAGLKLVERLVKQLQGSMQITNQSGVRFQILFKDTLTRKQII